MEYINEEVVLDFYLKEIANDKVSYLVGRDTYKNKIVSLVTELKKGGEINDRVNIAKSLWKCLFEASMTYIDPDRGGYDKLFKYFDDYVDFEELIFASDSFYRDHTFH